MTFATGSLVRARGREWVVLPESDDELVRVRPLGGTDDEATGILPTLETIEPARFALPDPAKVGDFHSANLLRDALRLGFRSSAGPFRSFGRIAVAPRPYQLVPLLMALKLDPVRLLIADDVGIGKTIEALLIARELLDQGTVRRSAVLCSPQLAEQWRAEMATKFHIDAELVLSSTVTRLERRLTSVESLFDVYPHVVVSTDYIKSDRRRAEFLRTAPELVIVDEAHTCVDAGGGGRGRHQRYELLKGLAADPDRHLLLVTATPHSGKEAPFRSLLGLIDPKFDHFPDDLSGAENTRFRRELADHFVQRRRADIRRYLQTDTAFPTRELAEVTYSLHPDYRAVFDRCLGLARRTALDDTGGLHRQRVRWWSALALLRSLASSPAAAAETLRNRAAAADTTTSDEADQVGRRTVLDQVEDEVAEAADVPPGADPDDPGESTLRRRLRELARDVEALAGDGDHKLATAIGMVRELVADGFNPILFCRFIPTAEYVAHHLRDALGRRATVDAVTGTLPPDEREARVLRLGASDGPRVLVATDCMSEGINLQEHFDAVIHYDLSWNPTRHEQREGRVDRFNQPSEVCRAVTFYGIDNHIDTIVRDVLLRKHTQIRKRLGISVPVPGDSNAVVEAIMEGVLLRSRDPQQLQLDTVAMATQQALFEDWEDAAERERQSRTMFAQQAINVDDVAREVTAAREAIGSSDSVAAFMTAAARAYGATVVARNGVVEFDFGDAARHVRDLVGPKSRFVARFDPPAGGDHLLLTRTHPVVEQLAADVLDRAVDPLTEAIAARCGAIRTRAVTTRTTLLVVRFRFHLLAVEADDEHPLLAEDAHVLAFTGAPEAAEWLDPSAAEALLEARPDANVAPDQARVFVQRVFDGWAHLIPRLDERAEQLADELVGQHRRVRDAARRKGVRFTARPHLPPDVLGAYVLLPMGQ